MPGYKDFSSPPHLNPENNWRPASISLDISTHLNFTIDSISCDISAHLNLANDSSKSHFCTTVRHRLPSPRNPSDCDSHPDSMK
jgi:hypothetical protein